MRHITAGDLTTDHEVINYGRVQSLTRKGMFVTADFKVTNWDLKSGTSYTMDDHHTWHVSEELAVSERADQVVLVGRMDAQEHPLVDSLAGKTVRVTIEVIE